MNSKEALNILWDELELYCSKHNDSVIHYWNLLEIIKDDLEKKEIPIKPIAHHYEEIGEKPYIKYSCPKCDNKYQLIKNYGKYCPHCGQRLDWSECNEQ